MTTTGCVWLIEKLFTRRPGAGRAEVFPSSGRLDLSWTPGSCDLPEFAAEMQRFGYGLEPFRNGTGSESEQSALAGRLGLCGAFALNAMVFTLPRYLGMADDFLLAGIFELITLLSATLALLIGGSYFIVRAWASLRRRVLHIDLPIALGIVMAYAGSLLGWTLGIERLLYFDFVAIFTFLMLGGRYLQVAATERVRRNLHGQNPLPSEVTLDDRSTIPLDQLAPGTGYQLASGEVVPVASILRDSRADLSLAWMTGEPAPVTIHAGRRVAAGAVNLNRQAIRLRAEEPISASLVAALARQGETASRSKLLERILRIYLAAVLFIALAGSLAWLLHARDPQAALQVALSILVVSCPCALGVAIPLLDQRAAAALQRLGVFVQTPTLWHRLARIRHILSGDQEDRVKSQAAALGLDPSRAHGGLAPQAKQAAVQQLDRGDALYLGDGANDSLAFDAATACGTPAADRSVLDSKADFFFTARGLGFLPALFAAAGWRQRTARQIVLLAVAYNLFAVAICLAGAMSPLLAAILMPLSSLACLGLAARRLPTSHGPVTKREIAPNAHSHHNVEDAVAAS